MNYKTLVTFTQNGNKIINCYLNDVNKYKVLTPEEEVRLFERYKNGDKSAKDAIINANQRFVISVAKHYCNNKNFLDFVSEGNLGLLDAIESYDVTTGFKFISYAIWHIRKRMLAFINQHNNLIRQPEHKLHKKAKQIQEKYFSENGIEMGECELNEVLNRNDNSIIPNNTQFKIQDFTDYYESSQTLNNLDNLITNNVEEKIIENHNQIMVNNLLTFLNTKEQIVLKHLFGIDGKTPLTLHETASILGLSYEGIRQIKKKALLKLKRICEKKKYKKYV